MNDPEKAIVEFAEEGIVQGILITPLTPGRYRLEEFPLFVEAASYGDVIEASPRSDGTLLFERVVQPAGYQRMLIFSARR